MRGRAKPSSRSQSQQNPGGNQGAHHACWAARAAWPHMEDCGETAHRLLLAAALTRWLEDASHCGAYSG